MNISLFSSQNSRESDSFMGCVMYSRFTSLKYMSILLSNVCPIVYFLDNFERTFLVIVGHISSS